MDPGMNGYENLPADYNYSSVRKLLFSVAFPKPGIENPGLWGWRISQKPIVLEKLGLAIKAELEK
ncbi:MAG: hypothetical protein R2860_14015 [Desulfobacterales bacterium]